MMMPRPIVRLASRAIDALRSRVALTDATSVGAGVRVFGAPQISCQGDFIVGPRVVFVSTPMPIRVVVGPGARLVIGAGSLIESGAVLRAHRSLTIGSDVRVGVGCVLDDEAAPGAVAVPDGTWLEDGAAAQAAPGRDDGIQAVEERIRAVIGRIVPGASRAGMGEDLRLIKDWDSLAALRVLVALEREFRVSLPHDLLTREPRLASVTPLVLGAVTMNGEAR
jgi:acyl carrier protein